MANTINRLTDITIRKASKPGMYCDGSGLYLRIAPRGSKSWIYRYWRNGRMHDVGLGPLLAVSLPVARQRAQKYREQRFVEGIDPLAAKRAAALAAKLDAAKAMNFEACAKAYIAVHQVGWRNAKHAAQWSATLASYAYPVFGSLPVQAIDVGLVMKAVEPIWSIKTETASRLRGRIESVLDWATTHGYRQGENPARWKGHLENLLPNRSKVAPVKHHAALPYAEIGAFMTELRTQEGLRWTQG
jgi:roadblock/LC7 domain-containing protein